MVLTAKRAAEICREWYVAFRNKGKGEEKCVLELLDAADTIEALEAAQPKWISVEERLPEPNTTVLLIAHGWEPQLVYIGELKKVESEKSWLTGLVSKASEWTVYGFSYLKEPIVTHWMPLPSMPEPQKEDA